MRGFISKEWEVIQNNFFQERGSRKYGRVWVSEFLGLLWSLTHDLWNIRNYTVLEESETNIPIHRLCNQEIKIQRSIGINNLPSQLEYIFRLPLKDIKKKVSYKKQCLATVLRSRRHKRVIGPDTEVGNFLNRWLMDLDGR